jgi:hypothetical protein
VNWLKVVHILIEKKKCSPECKLFKCSKNATIYRRDAVWCRWTDDLCDVANCAYAICIKRRLLPRGICGETIKRRTTDKRPEEVVGPPVKVRGKTLRRIGDKEIF